MMTLRPLATAAVLGLLALGACGKLGELERPGPLFGSGAEGAETDAAASRSVRTVDPRNRDDRPAPPRSLPIDSAPNPTSVAPQGALPDPYAYPR